MPSTLPSTEFRMASSVKPPDRWVRSTTVVTDEGIQLKREDRVLSIVGGAHVKEEGTTSTHLLP